MSSAPFHILIVDADAENAAGLSTQLASHGHDPRVVTRGDEALKLAVTGEFDAIITEVRLEGMGGLKLISLLHSKLPRLPVIMLTGQGSSNTAIESIQSGAYDYFTKPVEPGELLDVLEDAVASSRYMSKPVEIGSVYPDQDTIIGRSRAMTEIFKELGRVASKPVTVLIRGETGTGKELIARAIYQHGHRAHRPFVAVNCAAIPPSLLESELFGSDKGAYTGADKLRTGRFEQAHNGTLFLDEIGDMDLALQAKLLRVLQEKQIRRLGGRIEIPVDVRVIAATHRDLEKMAEEGTFRPDLFYRLNVASISIPPLRDRREDIAQLADYFLQTYGGEFGIPHPSIHSAGTKFLAEQDWPGNVRQLQNVIRKALIGSRGYTIGWRALRDAYDQSQALRPSNSESESESLHQLVTDTLRRAGEGDLPAAYPYLLEKLERELLAEAVQRAGGNQAQAARWLGISRLTLREKLHRYDIHPAGKKKDP